MALIAEGRSNNGIAAELTVTVAAVERHVTHIFDKLGLRRGFEDHRRVLAVLEYLKRPVSRPVELAATGGGDGVAVRVSGGQGLVGPVAVLRRRSARALLVVAFAVRSEAPSRKKTLISATLTGADEHREAVEAAGVPGEDQDGEAGEDAARPAGRSALTLTSIVMPPRRSAGRARRGARASSGRRRRRRRRAGASVTASRSSRRPRARREACALALCRSARRRRGRGRGGGQRRGGHGDHDVGAGELGDVLVVAVARVLGGGRGPQRELGSGAGGAQCGEAMAGEQLAGACVGDRALATAARPARW